MNHIKHIYKPYESLVQNYWIPFLISMRTFSYENLSVLTKILLLLAPHNSIGNKCAECLVYINNSESRRDHVERDLPLRKIWSFYLYFLYLKYNGFKVKTFPYVLLNCPISYSLPTPFFLFLVRFHSCKTCHPYSRYFTGHP